MKHYRFQAWAAGYKIDSTVNADNDNDAMNAFCKNLNEGNCKIEEDGLVNLKRFFVTYEEL